MRYLIEIRRRWGGDSAQGGDWRDPESPRLARPSFAAGQLAGELYSLQLSSALQRHTPTVYFACLR